MNPNHITERQRGFTLIELVLVIVIISVAAVPLFGLFTQATASLLDNEDLQTATQLAQAKAEEILGQRRAFDYAAIGLGTTNEPGVYGAFNRTTVITQPSPAPAACPAASNCKLVTVSVDKGGPALADVTLLLVEY